MDKQSIDMFLVNYSKFFHSDKLLVIREKMLTMPDDKFTALSVMSSELKDPTTALLLSIFTGGLGIDRFFIGDAGMGILKLLTAGGCGLLAIIDWFLISDRTKEKNFEKIAEILGKI